jgi:hypothetical protein
MGGDGEMDCEVSHFEDDVFYYCSDIPFHDEVELGSRSMRENLMQYLDAYAEAMAGMLEEDEEED